MLMINYMKNDILQKELILCLMINYLCKNPREKIIHEERMFLI
jgi:hypothetical protein